MVSRDESDQRRLVHLVLVGYRGVGKTSVGQLVSQQLGLTLVDTDALIEQRDGRTIVEIFRQSGERAFRELERAAVIEALRGLRRLVSTGGGVVTQPENVARLRRRGWVVWLTARPAVILDRLMRDPATGRMRPALTNLPQEQEIRELLERRQPLYSSAADVTLDVSDLSIAQSAESVIDAWKSRPQARSKRRSMRA